MSVATATGANAEPVVSVEQPASAPKESEYEDTTDKTITDDIVDENVKTDNVVDEVVVDDTATKDGSDESKTEEEAIEEVEVELVPLEDPGPPPEPISLPLTGQSRGIYGCPDGGSVTEENPMHMIPISVIKEDMKMRAGVCDFMPFRAQVEKFEGDEILVVLDADFHYGNNFYTFFDLEKQEQFIKTVKYAEYLKAVEMKKEKDKLKAREEMGLGSEDEEEDDDDEEEEEMVERPLEWISLGSESEVRDGMCVPTRPPIKLVISRRRRYFGAPTLFADGSKEVVNEDGENQTFAEFPSLVKAQEAENDDEDDLQPLHRVQTDRAVQAVAITADTSCQTNRPLPRNVGSWCDIGTRPADITPIDMSTAPPKEKPQTTSTSTTTATTTTTTTTASTTTTTPPATTTIPTTATPITTATATTTTTTTTTTPPPSQGATLKSKPSTAQSKPTTTQTKPSIANAKAKAKGKATDDDDDEGIVQDQDCDKTADMLTSFLSTVCPKVRGALVQNELLKLFDDEFSQLSKKDAARIVVGTTDTKLEEHQSYRYVDCEYDHSVSCAAWHPYFPDIVVVSCVRRLGAHDRSKLSMAASKSVVAVWNIHNPIEPQLLLQAPDEVYSLAFNEGEQYLLAGGCVNGQVLLWDLTAHFEMLELNAIKSVDKAGADQRKLPSLFCVAACAIEHGHRSSVSELTWLPMDTEISRNGSILPRAEDSQNKCYQIMSVASDASCLVWDLRQGVEKGGQYSRSTLKRLDLKWKPLLRVFVALEKGFDNGARKIAIRKPTNLCIEDKNDELRTMMYIGTEGGNIIHLDWRAPESDSGKIGLQKVESAFNAHAGPIKALRRSPFMPSLLLSVGGMNICLWHESTKLGPLLTFKTNGVRATAGEWSLQRPGVFFVGKSDGTVEIWDLMDTTYGPSVVDEVCSPLPITFLTPKDNVTGDEHFIAAGDDKGSMHIMMIPFGLTEQVSDEGNRLNGFVQEELRRLEYVSTRFEARAATPSDTNHNNNNNNNTEEETTDIPESGLVKQKLEAYKHMEREFLIEMGLMTADPIVEAEE